MTITRNDLAIRDAAPDLYAALKELRLASLAYSDGSDLPDGDAAERDAAFARLIQARNTAYLVLAKAEGR